MCIRDSLQGLRYAFEAHVTEVEHEKGLLPQLRLDAPRLSNGIDRMHAEHKAINIDLEGASSLVQSCAGGCSPEMVESVREAIGNLLLSISRHRQRGADLVYEAYNVDIGGG